MTPESDPDLPARRVREHRALDGLFERFLEALAASDPDGASAAMASFDDALRRHTAFEDENLTAGAPGKLIASADEDADARRSRELRLEHVQLRELSGILRRLLAERRDLGSVPGLAANLARRWEAHTAREEREVRRAGD